MDNNIPKTPAPALTLDVDLYQHYLDNSDLSPEEKLEFIQTLWNLVTEFVMLGWNVHPAQQSCGQENQNALPATNNDSDTVNLQYGNLISAFAQSRQKETL